MHFFFKHFIHSHLATVQDKWIQVALSCNIIFIRTQQLFRNFAGTRNSETVFDDIIIINTQNGIQRDVTVSYIFLSDIKQ
jgi:hypothetical protein